MGPDSLYCGKWRKIQRRCDLELDPTMPIIEIVRDFCIRQCIPISCARSIVFESIVMCLDYSINMYVSTFLQIAPSVESKEVKKVLLHL